MNTALRTISGMSIFLGACLFAQVQFGHMDISKKAQEYRPEPTITRTVDIDIASGPKAPASAPYKDTSYTCQERGEWVEKFSAMEKQGIAMTAALEAAHKTAPDIQTRLLMINAASFAYASPGTIYMTAKEVGLAYMHQCLTTKF